MSVNLEISKESINQNYTVLKKYQCPECKGYGMIKTNSTICDKYDGYKYLRCNTTGLPVMPYNDCYNCETLGEIQVKIYLNQK